MRQDPELELEGPPEGAPKTCPNCGGHARIERFPWILDWLDLYSRSFYCHDCETMQELIWRRGT